MTKILIANEEQFDDLISSLIGNGIDATLWQRFKPDQYPCVFAYSTRDIDSMKWGWDLTAECIYLSDFEV